MVYEFLPIYSQYYQMNVLSRNPKERAARKRYYARLILRGAPVQILATCRLIKEEAASVILSNVEILRRECPRIILQSGAATPTLDHLFTQLDHWVSVLAVRGMDANFHDWAHKQNGSPRDGRFRFIWKAGIAMRWQATHLRDGPIAYDTTSVYIGLRMLRSPCHMLRLPISSTLETTVPYGNTYFYLGPGGRMEMDMYGLPGYQPFTLREAQDPPSTEPRHYRFIIGWEVPRPQESDTVEVGDHWEALGLEDGWEIGDRVS
jgi:hypothetical protein